MSKKGRVLVAMSGGIDSTVAAVMLHNEGYEVVGITMKTWDYAASGGTKKETGCCSLDSINDARAVAVALGFHHFIIDIRDEFGDQVIDNFVEEYLAGRTPNPCILCNTHIKWAALLRRADALQCEFIATGHYAQKRLNPDNNRYYITRGLDRHKDQSYVLWGLPQESLSRTIFPIGSYHKPDIRQMAADWGFSELSTKPESYEICFIPDNDYRGFLKRRAPEAISQLVGGNFVNRQGKVLGKHDGYPFYTIGQRKGLGIALGKPAYVVDIVPETNTVVLGDTDELMHGAMQVQNITLQKYDNLYAGADTLTQIRAHHKAEPAYVQQQNNHEISVHFVSPVEAITPGQSAVFYEGDDVLGGGHIKRSPVAL